MLATTSDAGVPLSISYNKEEEDEVDGSREASGRDSAVRINWYSAMVWKRDDDGSIACHDIAMQRR